MTLAILDARDKEYVLVAAGADLLASYVQQAIAAGQTAQDVLDAILAAGLSEGVFPSLAAGESGTTDGQYFWVGDAGTVVLYRNDAGVGTEIAELATAASLAGKVDTAALASSSGGEMVGYEPTDAADAVALTTRKILDNCLYIESYGGVPDYDPVTKTGTPVDDAFNLLISDCIRLNKTAVIRGSFYSRGGMKISAPVRIMADAQIWCDNADDDVALEIGTAGVKFSTSASGNHLLFDGCFALRKIRNGANQPLWWADGDTTSIGMLEHSIAAARFSMVKVDGFNSNRVWESSGSAGYATNNNYSCDCNNGRRNIHALIADNGYVNENKWFGGHISNTGATPAPAAATVRSMDFEGAGPNEPNNNVWIGTNIEDHTSAVVFITNGLYNGHIFCRFEGLVAGSLKYLAGTESNYVDRCCGISSRVSAPVSDLGQNTFMGWGVQYHQSYHSFGTYQGRNDATSAGGGLARYPVFGAVWRDQPGRLASALGHEGIGTFPNSSGQSGPNTWLDAATGRLYLAVGGLALESFLGPQSDGTHFFVGSAKAGVTGSLGGFILGGWFNNGHLKLRRGTQDYHFWVDSGHNLRCGRTANNVNPSSETAGSVVIAIPSV